MLAGEFLLPSYAIPSVTCWGLATTRTSRLSKRSSQISAISKNDCEGGPGARLSSCSSRRRSELRFVNFELLKAVVFLKSFDVAQYRLHDKFVAKFGIDHHVVKRAMRPLFLEIMANK